MLERASADSGTRGTRAVAVPGSRVVLHGEERAEAHDLGRERLARSNAHARLEDRELGTDGAGALTAEAERGRLAELPRARVVEVAEPFPGPLLVGRLTARPALDLAVGGDEISDAVVIERGTTTSWVLGRLLQPRFTG